MRDGLAVSTGRWGMDDLLKRVEAALSGRYEIESELGRGGMAVVYRGRDLRHERDVAIKVLPPHLASAIGHERFLHEIKLAAGLAHPYVVPILDSGKADGLLYYTMPVVRGETLQDRLRREAPLPIGEAVTIAREVAEALAHAHAAGVLHRDVKPSNILLTHDHALLSDFGVARAAEASGDERLTGTGVIIGTPTYMSPQQALSEDGLDASADQYSLGCVLYEMLTGRVPFDGGSPQTVLLAHATRDPTPLRTVRPEIPASLAEVVDRAMAKNPADRFPSIAAFRDALAGGVTGTPARSWPAGSHASRGDAPEASPLRRATSVMLLGLVATGAVWGISTLLAGRRALESTTADRIAVLPCRTEPGVGAGSDSLGIHTAYHIWNWLSRSPDFHLVPWARVDGRAYPARDSLPSVAAEIGAASLVSCSLGPGRRDSVVLTYDIWLDGHRGPSRHATAERWPSGVVDIQPVAGEIATVLAGIPTSGEAPFALTHSDLAFERWSLANRAFLEGRFFEAETLFVAAHQADSSFVLALYRARDANRWYLGSFEDTTSLEDLYERHRDKLGRRYRLYLSAAVLRARPEAFDQYAAILDSLPDDDHAHLLYGDELLHRGPLFGHGLEAAEKELRRASTLNPKSSPAWSHLAVALQRQGRDSAAALALRGLRDALPDGERSRTYVLWQHAWRERFQPSAAAPEREMLFTDPEALPLYARYGVRLFDLPELQLVLGLTLARAPPGSDDWHTGTNATALAHAALGRPGRAGEDWRRAAAAAPPDVRPAAQLFADQWDVLPVALGLEGFGAERSESVARLEATAADTAAARVHRARAAWTLARRAAENVGRGADTIFAGRSRTASALARTTGFEAQLIAYLEAVAAARDSRWPEAIRRSRDLIVYDEAEAIHRPFGRAALYLDRGVWFKELAIRESDPALADSARAMWIWHLNTALEGTPRREVQAGEVDAVLGAHARLRIARLADAFLRAGNPRDPERWRAIGCRESAEALRRWASADDSLEGAIDELGDIRLRLECAGFPDGTGNATSAGVRDGAAP